MIKKYDKTIRIKFQVGNHERKNNSELKIGFGLEDIPTGDYFANPLFFAIGVLVYNTAVIMKLHL
jgi:hypothetical protein